MERTDAEIVDRVLAGDRGAFGGLVERHGAALWGAITRLLDNREDAREVFQETWLRTFERLASLRDPDRLRSWIVSIALNHARQRLRRGVAEHGAAADGGAADSAPGAAEAVERGELVARVRAEAARLPPRQRQVVELRLNQALSHAEIGDLLGISEESARANYYQAMRRLRARWDELEGGPARGDDR